MELAYRGKANKGALERLGVVAANGAPSRTAGPEITVWLPAGAEHVLSEASHGRRAAGIAEIAAIIDGELAKLPPTKPRSRTPKPPVEPKSADRAQMRTCASRGRRKHEGHFVGAQGIRCYACRVARRSATPIRVIRGGSPGLGRR